MICAQPPTQISQTEKTRTPEQVDQFLAISDRPDGNEFGVRLRGGRRNDPALPILRRVLREAREVAHNGRFIASVGSDSKTQG